MSLGSLPADTVAITRERPFQNSSERLEAGIVVRFEGRLIKPKRHVLSSTTPRWLSEGLDKRIGWRHGRGTTQGIETLPFSNETAFTACDSVSRIFGLMQYTKNVAGTTTLVVQRCHPAGFAHNLTGDVLSLIACSQGTLPIARTNRPPRYDTSNPLSLFLVTFSRGLLATPFSQSSTLLAEPGAQSCSRKARTARTTAS